MFKFQPRGIGRLLPGFPKSYDGTKLLSFVSDVKAGAPLNVLSANRPARDGRAIPFVSDSFDFSVYLHAAEKDLEKSFISRFMRLRDTSFRVPQSYFKKYAGLDDPQAEATARHLDKNLSSQSARIHPCQGFPPRVSR